MIFRVCVCLIGESSTDDIDILNRKTKWQRKRKREFDYTATSDKYSTITEHSIDVRGTEKREVITISDLHLGGAWADGMDGKLELYLNTILERAREKVKEIVREIVHVKALFFETTHS
mgnify:FL=1